jgi:hypothetical protein
VITRDGKPVTDEDIAWLKANRLDVGLIVDSVTMTRQMRDEDWP